MEPTQTEAKRALVIMAHADDAEFGNAGTVAKWVREGYEVTYVICSDNSKGSDDPEMTRDNLVALRQEEQRRAADVLGVKDVIFLGYVDGEIEDSPPLRRDLVRIIRRLKPERVICGDPSFRVARDGYINHPDHVAVASAACAAIYPFARNRPTFPELLDEGLEPHKVAEVWMGSWDNANRWVDIEDTIELKIAALREHKSQLSEWDPTEMVRNWARMSGAGQLIEHAEAYRVITLR